MMDDNGLVGVIGVDSKLFRMICKKKWTKVIKFLKTRSGMTQAKQTDSFGNTAISAAVTHQAPMEVIENILLIQPEFSLQVDCYGMIPLHLACQTGASCEVIKALLRQDNGAGAQAVDLRRKTPLHYSMDYMCNPVKNGNTNGIHGSPENLHNSSLTGSLSMNGTAESSGTTGSSLSMSADEFQDQLNAIEELVAAAPRVVLCTDSQGRTPIDILQDCKASNRHGPKWERADIICEYLRKVSVQVYMEEKAKHEMIGFNEPRTSSGSGSGSGSGSNCTPSATSTNGSSTLSGYSQISALSRNGVDSMAVSL